MKIVNLCFLPFALGAFRRQGIPVTTYSRTGDPPQEVLSQVLPEGTHGYVPGVYRYLVNDVPSATKTVSIWQPFNSNEGGGLKAQHFIDAALEWLQSDPLYLRDYRVEVRNADWGGVVSETICEPGLACPEIILLGTSQVPIRYKSDRLHDLSLYLDRWLQKYGYVLSDDFVRFYFYDFYRDDRWTALPFVTDSRLFLFNVTLYESLNLRQPPPYGEWAAGEWTWEAAAEQAKVLQEAGSIGFDFIGAWDEELKLFLSLAQEANVRFLRSEPFVSPDGAIYDRTTVQKCGLRDPSYVDLVDKTLTRMFVRDRSASLGGLVPYQDQSYSTWKGRPLGAPWERETNLCCVWADDTVQGFGYFPTEQMARFLELNKTEVRAGFVPTRFSFLGGSGLIMLEGARYKEEAYEILDLLLDPVKPYLKAFALSVGSPPPYESALRDPEWLRPEWNVAVQSLLRAVPPQYPLSSFPEYGPLEGEKPFRFVIPEMLEFGLSTAEALHRACDHVDHIFRARMVCSADDCTCNPNVACPVPPNPALFAVLVTLGVFGVILVVVGAVFVHMQRSRKRRLRQWDIPWSSITEPSLKRSTSKGSVGSNMTGGSTDQQSLEVHLWKGEPVQLVEVHLRSGVSRERLYEQVRLTTDGSFPVNVLRLYGITHKPGASTVFYLVYEYASRGTLADFLGNETLTLTDEVLKLLVSDLCRGLQALHGRNLILGNLTSDTVFLDRNFTIKIGRYACNDYVEYVEHGTSENHRLRWKAPEQLSDEPAVQGSDIFALGVILIHLMTGKEPYDGNESVDNMSAASFKHAVIHRSLRPSLEPLTSSPLPWIRDLGESIGTLLQPGNAMRGTASDLLRSVSLITQVRKKKTMVEIMLELMSNYSESLERTVRERTALLEQEKERNFAIVCSMVPRSIAVKLRDGVRIEPERFDMASLYFSDVCSFTTISSTIEPRSVITMLSDMFKHYDRILQEEKIYKVETIGDAYVAASGLPERIQDHAERVLRFACRVMIFMTHKFVPPSEIRRDLLPVRIRIGLHSGSIVAGVIGTEQNPRYNLFGDTMNTASRMESTSEPGRIQCSEVFYEQCKSSRVAIFETRGEIEVKGKGTMRTYWVIPSGA